MRNRELDIDMMFDPNLKMESIFTEDKKFRIYRNFAIETGKTRMVNGNWWQIIHLLFNVTRK